MNKHERMVNRNFTPFPVLTTERLSLRQLSKEDAQAIFTLRSDPAVNKYLDRPTSKTIEDAVAFINKIAENIQKNDSVYWAITLSYSKIFVGTICLFGFSEESRKCEIGFELLATFQGQGIMKEAAKKVIDYAFQTMQVQKIEAFTHDSNQSSTKLLEKLNFKMSLKPDRENPKYNLFTLTDLNYNETIS